MPMKIYSEDEIFNLIGDAYLSLIHLGDGVDEDANKILNLSSGVDNNVISKLLCGQSWRERLVGLVLATDRGPDQFFKSLTESLFDIRGISIIPTCAVMSIAVTSFGFKYKPNVLSDLDRSIFDGELGTAIDHFHFAIGDGKEPSITHGENYGQEFENHKAFYLKLSAL
ncbi:MAG: hypothetical protein COA79_17970 [Planctomycetota bacterium]|nr:MAG: hypothetical protein COA79_17970 [Planctomycetota bacterium]